MDMGRSPWRVIEPADLAMGSGAELRSFEA